MSLNRDRVVIVTGAGRGLGRAHALAFAASGACVVVNDIGTSLAGDGSSTGPVDEVVAEIRAAGGRAIANTDDVADFVAAGNIVKAALDEWGRIDVVVNNAGVLRDRMFVSSGVDEWDAVMHVHLRGHYGIARHACAHWRNESKAGRQPDARIINTSSGAGLQGSIGQSAYACAKGGIAALTLVQAAELARYGVTSNAIAPAARTRMTEGPFAAMMAAPDDGSFDAMHPANVSPLLVWLGSPEASAVTGRIFEVAGGKIGLADGWRTGPEVDKCARWTPEELGPVIHDLIERSTPPQKVYGT